MRQDERLLIEAVNDLANGAVAPDSTSAAFLVSLNKPLNVPANEKKVLFPHNKTAATYNLQQMTLWPGEKKVYRSVDKGLGNGLARINVAQVYLIFFPISFYILGNSIVILI